MAKYIIKIKAKIKKDLKEMLNNKVGVYRERDIEYQQSAVVDDKNSDIIVVSTQRYLNHAPVTAQTDNSNRGSYDIKRDSRQNSQ